MILLEGGAMAALYSGRFYESILSFDAGILLWLQDVLRNDVLDAVMKFITHSVDGGVFWILLTVVLLAVPKTRKWGLCAAMALILSLIVCNGILKNVFQRIRPYEVIAGLELLQGVDPANDPSFPSGHTSSSFASATAIFLASDKKYKVFTVFAIVYAALVGFSRLYVGIHYPTDVIAGALIAIGLAFLAAFLGGRLYDFLADKIKAAKEKKKQKVN